MELLAFLLVDLVHTLLCFVFKVKLKLNNLVHKAFLLIFKLLHLCFLLRKCVYNLVKILDLALIVAALIVELKSVLFLLLDSSVL
jgi:hypothetical protein